MKMDSYTNISVDITKQVREKSDRFIFETISSWFHETYKMIVSKRVLIRAMKCFKEEHPEEYAALIKEVEE